MNSNEQYFRRVIGAIGGALLLMLVFLQLFQAAIWAFWVILPAALLSSVQADVLYELCYALVYLACFLVPAWVLRCNIKRAGYYVRPVQTEVRISPWWLLAIPACVAIVFSAAYCNAMLTELLNPFGSGWESTPELGTASAPYELVLRFITVCLVPGFCEELLFRGVILENCLPFGRGRAIFISALLFALMHQNPEQIFYTFVAGILFGLVYERTHSIWLVTLMHIFNNFASVIEEFVSYRMPNDVAIVVVLWIVEILLLALGVLAILALLRHTPTQQRDFADGIFGKSAPSLDFVVAAPVEKRRAVRLFLCPAMLIFVVLCAMQVLVTLLLNGVV